MNAPDTKTEAQQLEGTNVPEFHAALDLALAQVVPAGAQITVWRRKSNRRDFTVRPDVAGSPEGGPWEKIVTLRALKAAAKVERESLESGLRGATIGALGYHWRPCHAVQKPSGEVGWSSEARGFLKLGTAKPHPAGFSR